MYCLAVLQSCQPLLLAAHDLALLVLAGFPPNSCEALTRLRQQLQQEAVQEETHTTLSQPGAAGARHAGISQCSYVQSFWERGGVLLEHQTRTHLLIVCSLSRPTTACG